MDRPCSPVGVTLCLFCSVESSDRRHAVRPSCCPWRFSSLLGLSGFEPLQQGCGNHWCPSCQLRSVPPTECLLLWVLLRPGGVSGAGGWGASVTTGVPELFWSISHSDSLSCALLCTWCWFHGRSSALSQLTVPTPTPSSRTLSASCVGGVRCGSELWTLCSVSLADGPSTVGCQSLFYFIELVWVSTRSDLAFTFK